MTKPRVHMVIPDCQVKPGVDVSHMRWIGNYIAEKRPDVIVNIGDFADMESLSSYDIGKGAAEGKRYAADVRSVRTAMTKLCSRFQGKRYRPELHLTLGNHEDRIRRAANDAPALIGTLSVADLGYAELGWKVHPFLRVVKIDQIEYSHYYVSGNMGRPVSSAAALLRVRQGSAVMGHVQRIDMAIHPFTQRIALFTGIAYLHDEEYLTPQGQNTKRGIWMLHEVHDGTFDPMFVSLDFLRRRYS